MVPLHSIIVLITCLRRLKSRVPLSRRSRKTIRYRSLIASINNLRLKTVLKKKRLHPQKLKKKHPLNNKLRSMNKRLDRRSQKSNNAKWKKNARKLTIYYSLNLIWLIRRKMNVLICKRLIKNIKQSRMQSKNSTNKWIIQLPK